MRAPLSARPMAGGAGPHGPGTMEREPRPRGLWRDCGMGRCRPPTTGARRRASSPVQYSQDTDGDQINGHDVVEQARDDENKDAGDQGYERRERDVEIHKLKSHRGLEATSLPDFRQARPSPLPDAAKGLCQARAGMR